MKTAFTFIIALTISFTTLNANTTPTDVEPVPNALAEQPAMFLGDNSLIQPWLTGEVVYPAIAMENGREGRVVVEFVIDENGRPINFTTKQGIGLGCEEAVIAAITQMPNWTPARISGQYTPVTMAVAVDFSMQ